MNGRDASLQERKFGFPPGSYVWPKAASSHLLLGLDFFFTVAVTIAPLAYSSGCGGLVTTLPVYLQLRNLTEST